MTFFISGIFDEEDRQNLKKRLSNDQLLLKLGYSWTYDVNTLLPDNSNEYMSSLSDVTKVALMTLSIIITLWCHDIASENFRTTINHRHPTTFLSNIINIILPRFITVVGILFIIYLFVKLTKNPEANTSNQMQSNYTKPLYVPEVYKSIARVRILYHIKKWKQEVINKKDVYRGSAKGNNDEEMAERDVEEVKIWLNFECGLGEYFENFIQNNFDDLKTIKYAFSGDSAMVMLEYIGVKSIDDRYKLKSHIECLHEVSTKNRQLEWS